VSETQDGLRERVENTPHWVQCGNHKSMTNKTLLNCSKVTPNLGATIPSKMEYKKKVAQTKRMVLLRNVYIKNIYLILV